MSSSGATFDVVVVGFGGAGACAAIAAAESGAAVVVIDRFYGGGSTAQSGGVVYAGGGTRQQAQAGIRDTPDAMFEYLRREVADAVSRETLRRFVDGSREMILWLERQGVAFDGSLCPYKTSYPTNRHYLYYSGNEQIPENAAVAPPAPRGHRTRAKNLSGAAFYGALKVSALSKGITFLPLARANSLVVDGGQVVGVDYEAPPLDRLPGRRHRRLTSIAAKLSIYCPPLGRRLGARVERSARMTTHRVMARGGVVLATGGFAFDRELVAKVAAPWARAKVSPLGTIGEDGAALRLTADLGAARGHLDRMSGWRFICPPSAFMKGIVVGASGARVGNEQLYGATLARTIIEEHDGRAFLICDAKTWRAARRQVPGQSPLLLVGQALWVFLGNGRGAETIQELARRRGIDPAALARTVADYNAAIAEGRSDRFGKSDELRTPIASGPFYCVDCSSRASPAFPFPFITLGGLVVDEQTGAVQLRSGDTIGGLYAAGRAAVGLCSHSYVSGLSLADAVFSGRRAGLAAAASTGRMRAA